MHRDNPSWPGFDKGLALFTLEELGIIFFFKIVTTQILFYTSDSDPNEKDLCKCMNQENKDEYFLNMQKESLFSCV